MNEHFDKMRTDLEDFGKNLYTRVANSRKAKAALASVEYLDDVGVLKPLHAKEIVKQLRPSSASSAAQ